MLPLSDIYLPIVMIFFINSGLFFVILLNGLCPNLFFTLYDFHDSHGSRFECCGRWLTRWSQFDGSVERGSLDRSRMTTRWTFDPNSTVIHSALTVRAIAGSSIIEISTTNVVN